MLRDDEAEEIEQQIRQGWRGPRVLRWVERLLQDRQERRAREQRIKKMLEDPGCEDSGSSGSGERRGRGG